MADSKNLIEALTDEILRVTEIKKIYDEIPAGAFAAAMMGASIEKARKAQSSGDILQMIPALQELQEFEL